MMKDYRDRLGAFLVGILVIAVIKWMTERVLRYLAVSSNVIMVITIGGWGMLALASFLFLRNWIVAYREQYQVEGDLDPGYEMFGLRQDRNSDVHTENIMEEFRGLYWRLYLRVSDGEVPTTDQRETDKTEKIDIPSIEGPYCPKDECILYQEKTYFGKYRFRCHFCQYHTKKTESSATLIQDLRNTIDVKTLLDGVDRS